MATRAEQAGAGAGQWQRQSVADRSNAPRASSFPSAAEVELGHNALTKMACATEGQW